MPVSIWIQFPEREYRMATELSLDHTVPSGGPNTPESGAVETFSEPNPETNKP